MGLMKKLTSAVVASSLVLSAAGTVLAAPSADEQSASFARMEALKLVVGTDQGPELDGPLTRAQLLTIIVRAFQQETAANLLKDLGSFSDVPGGQWYSGYVAVAKNLATERGFAIGYPDGTFQPNKQVSVIEALAMIMKFLGVPTGTGDNWIAQTIENAKAYGVITDADVENYFADPNAPATRGVAIALADQIFSTYKVAGTNKTVYTYYVDTQAPVISVDPIGTPTVDTNEVTIKGKIEGADKAFVTPQGGEAQEITVDANGNFSVVVPLVAGENNIVISATDIAGNYSEYVVRVNRVAGAAAEIQVASTEITVPAGSEFELGYKVVDATGLELAEATAAVKVTVEGEIGTVDGGVLTASEKVGTGTITLSYEGLEDVVINVKIVPAELDGVKIETESAAPGEAVKLIAVDAYGNAITEGVVFSTDEEKAFIKGDIFTASEPGVYKVTATQGEKSVTSEIKVYGEIEDLVIEAPAEMVRNGETEYEITVKAVDENGALVRNFEETVYLYGDFDTPDPVEAENGIAKFKITVPTDVTTLTITAETYYDGELIDKEIQVKTVKPVATALKLTSSSPYYGLGPRAIAPSVTLQVVDQAGAGIEYDDEAIEVNITGPARLVDEDDNEVRSFELLKVDADGVGLKVAHRDGETEGDITITATSDELGSASVTLKAIQVGRARNLVASQRSSIGGVAIEDEDEGWGPGYALVRIGLTDSNGIPVRPADDYEVTLKFDHSDVEVAWTTGNSVQFATNFTALTLDDDNEATVSFYDGKGDPNAAHAYIWLKLKAVKGKDVSFTAKSPRMTSASVDVKFKAGKAEGLAFNKYVTLDEGETEIVEFQLVDQNEAPVKQVAEFKLWATDLVNINGKTYTDPTKPAVIRTNSEGIARVRISAGRLMDDEATIYVQLGNATPEQIDVHRATSEAQRLEVKTTPADLKKVVEGDTVTFEITPKRSAGRDLLKADRYEWDGVVVTISSGNQTLYQEYLAAIPQDLTVARDDQGKDLGFKVAFKGNGDLGEFQIKFETDGKYKVAFTDVKSSNQASVSKTVTVSKPEAQKPEADSLHVTPSGTVYAYEGEKVVFRIELHSAGKALPLDEDVTVEVLTDTGVEEITISKEDGYGEYPVDTSKTGTGTFRFVFSYGKLAPVFRTVVVEAAPAPVTGFTVLPDNGASISDSEVTSVRVTLVDENGTETAAAKDLDVKVTIFYGGPNIETITRTIHRGESFFEFGVDPVTYSVTDGAQITVQIEMEGFPREVLVYNVQGS